MGRRPADPFQVGAHEVGVGHGGDDLHAPAAGWALGHVDAEHAG